MGWPCSRSPLCTHTPSTKTPSPCLLLVHGPVKEPERESPKGWGSNFKGPELQLWKRCALGRRTVCFVDANNTYLATHYFSDSWQFNSSWPLLFLYLCKCIVCVWRCVIHTRLWPLIMRANSPEMLSMRLEGGGGVGGGGGGGGGGHGSCFSSPPPPVPSPSCPSLYPLPMKHASPHPSIPSSFTPSLVRDSSIILSLALLERKTNKFDISSSSVPQRQDQTRHDYIKEKIEEMKEESKRRKTDTAEKTNQRRDKNRMEQSKH